MRIILIAAVATALFGCATTNTNTPGVGTHLSAAQEEAVAQQQDREAAQRMAAYDPNAKQVKEICAVGGRAAFGDCWNSVVNPTAKNLDEAKELTRAAAEHRAASLALRNAEESACAGLSDYDRDVSPFAHHDDILNASPLAKGAIVVFKPVPTLTAAHLQKMVDCHVARNDAMAHNVPEMLYCPLVPRDVSARVVTTEDGYLAVKIESTDPDAAREVRYRAMNLTHK
jgi:hypothetical protein